MSRIWFKPKQFGYGATPVSLEGWALVILFAALLAADIKLVPRLFADPRAGLPAAVIVAVIMTAGLIGLAQARTEGLWRWRWGKDD